MTNGRIKTMRKQNEELWKHCNFKESTIVELICIHWKKYIFFLEYYYLIKSIFCE